MSDSTVPSPFKNKDFQKFLLSRFSFVMATQMISLYLAWYMYELTGNKLSLGLLGLSEIIPAIALALYAGHIIDISDKRTLLLKFMFFYVLAALGLTIICSNNAKQMLGMHGVEYAIYALVFCTGVFRAFTGPTQQSIVAQLVTREQLPKAITMGGGLPRSAAHGYSFW